MSAASLAKYVYFAYLSKPAASRPLYRAIRRLRARQVVQFGLGDTQLAARLIRLCSTMNPRQRAKLFGIDLFELGQGPTRLSLKQAHRLLGATGAQVRLLPGESLEVVERHANAMTGTDLVVIAAGMAFSDDSRAWMYLPRMLSAQGLVFQEQPGRDGQPDRFIRLSREEVERRAARHAHRRAA